MSRLVQASKSADVDGLAEMSTEGLTRIVFLMIECMAHCDAKGIAVPEDFVTHFGVVRSYLMRKCVGPDYTESEFRAFFGVVVDTACEQYGATPARLDSLQIKNQLIQ